MKSCASKKRRWIAAVTAGGLFALAGLIEMLGYARTLSTTAYDLRHSTSMLAVGAMFISLSGLWISIAARWRKEDNKTLS